MCCGKMRQAVDELAVLQLNSVQSVTQQSGCLHAKRLKCNKPEFPDKVLTD